MGLTRHSPTPDIEYDELFNPLHLLEVVLDEENDVLEFLERQRDLYSRQPTGTTAKPAENSIGPASDPLWRARESLVRTLFSHHDFITIH